MGADDASGTDSTGPDDASATDGESDPPATDHDERPRDGRPASSGRRREVVVPLPVYKVITVFSTLFAVVLVVGGMIALDAATGRATVEPDEISLPLAGAGVLAIVLGATVYAFSTRFRAEGMGNPKEGADELSDDG